MYKRVLIAFSTLTAALVMASALDRLPGEWANWRGPQQTGVSEETGLPSRWSPSGENLLWKVPVGGRSAPVVMGDRVYIENSTIEGALEQEQLVCLDGNTGKTLWQHRFNIYGSDVPPHRVGWASPVGDPTTGNVYIMGANGTFQCIDPNGKVVWTHYLAEEFGAVTTHGGRTVTPVIYGDMVITSLLCGGWGAHAAAGHRYLACDKKTGEILYFAQPGGRPYDTCYPTILLGEFGGKKMMVDGNADGAIYGMKLLTGERVWSFPYSKRAINSAAVTDGKLVFVTHGQENYDTNVMGRLSALNPTLTGDITKTGEVWRSDGLIVEFPSPVYRDGKLYVVDNGANMICLDSSNGKEKWRLSLGTIQKASPVYADGKLWVGTENGKFFIIQPTETDAKKLSEVELSKVAGEEEILASVAVAQKRVFMVSTKNAYCIGKQGLPAMTKFSPVAPGLAPDPSTAPAAWLQVVPAESLLAPGQEVRFRARSFDANGNFIREETPTWSLAGLRGNISADGKFTSATGAFAGEVRATVGNVSGAGRVRVVPPLPWTEDFESYAPKSVPPHWVGAGAKFEVREVEGTKVLVKLANEFSLLQRGRAYLGSWNLSNYTMECDILGIDQKRKMPDVAIIAQRYALVLMGNSQKLTIESWTPEIKRQVSKPFDWKGNVWYRMKLRVDNQAGGKTLVRGRVWPRGAAEPQDWTITKEDPIPNLLGAPGLYCYAFNETYFDNIKVTPNAK